MFAVFAGNVFGQFNYQKGYIVKHNGDTIHGFIKEKGGIKNSKICIFKETKNGEAVKFFPEDIASFQILGDKLYKSKQIEIKEKKKTVFLEVLLEGETSLYYNWKGKPASYFIETENKALLALPKNYPAPKTKNNRYKDYTNIDSYKDTLSIVFFDNENTLKQIHLVNYTGKSLSNITKSYVQDQCRTGKCYTYEKDFNLSKPHYGVFTGVRLADVTIKNNTEGILLFPVGIYYNFPMALINDRLSFQIELVYFKASYPKGHYLYYNKLDLELELKSNIISIPLLFKYKLLKSRFSSSIGLGKETSFAWGNNIELFKKTGLNAPAGGWFFELGFDYKLSSKMSIFSNIRYIQNYNFEFFPNLVEKDIDEYLPASSLDKTYNIKFTHKSFLENISIPTVFIGVNF